MRFPSKGFENRSPRRWFDSIRVIVTSWELTMVQADILTFFFGDILYELLLKITVKTMITPVNLILVMQNFV